MQPPPNKTFLAIISLIVIVIALAGLYIIFTTQSSRTSTNEALSPTSFVNPVTTNQARPMTGVSITLVPKAIKEIPTLPFAQGGGIDVQSENVQASIAEIAKLELFLPYTQTVTTNTNINIDLLIAKRELQPNRWTLLVQMDGIDFQAAPNSADYTLMKNAFREGVNTTFAWLRSHNVDPAKIIFAWSDRKLNQDRALEWLSL